MKTLLILGIVYAISLTVVAIILLDHKRRTQTLPVENGWWYPLIVLGAPFIVLVVPVVLIRVLMKRRSREEAQTRRKEKANQKFLKRAYARMAKMSCYEQGAEHPLNCNVAQGLRQHKRAMVLYILSREPLQLLRVNLHEPFVCFAHELSHPIPLLDCHLRLAVDGVVE